ncbi:MAG: hypothetical protein RSC43_01340 [Clostridia bacterium]
MAKKINKSEDALSLDDVLNSAHDVGESDGELNLEEILAEFSDKATITDEPETPIPWQPIKGEKDSFAAEIAPKMPAKTKPVRRETPVREEKKAKEPARVAEKPRVAHKAVPKPKTAPARQDARCDDTLNLNELFDDNEPCECLPECEAHETPGEYVKRMASHVRTLGIRSFFAFLLCIPACYLSFAELCHFPIPSMISFAQHPFRFLLALSAIMLLSIIIHLDVMGGGLKKLLTLRPGMMSVIAFSALASLTHALCATFNRGLRTALPFSAVTCVTLFFTGYGIYKLAGARVRSCKTAAAAKEPQALYLSERDDEVNIIKSGTSETEFFTKYVQITDGAERFWVYLAPIIIIAEIAMACISSFGVHCPSRFMWALAGISAVSAPFFTMMCYAIPFSKISKKLSSVGAAIAGWYAAFSLSGERNLVIRDSDMFPKGTVALRGIKVFGNHSLEKAICYASSIVDASGSGLAPVMNELLKSQFGKKQRVMRLQHHESGGMEADVCGDHVLLGGASFMLRMGIRIDAAANVKNAMYIAINASLAGVFNLNYKIGPDVRSAISGLMKRRVTPVMAALDCNQNPVMVEKALKLRSGSIEYPRIEDRLELASDEQNFEYDPCAVVTRDGITPLSSAVLGARRLRRSTIRNVTLATICLVIGMLLMFYITFVGSVSSGTPYNVFLYLILWTIPICLLSARASVN